MKFFFITNMTFSFSYWLSVMRFIISLYVALPKITIYIKTNIMSTTDPFMDFVVVLSFA